MTLHKRLIHLVAVILASSVVALLPGVPAADDMATVIERQGGDRMLAREAELESIRRSVTISKKRQAALEQEIRDIEADRAKLSRELIDTAQRLQRYDREIARVEEKLGDLYIEQDAIRASLMERREVLAEVLLALQRMGRTPPPALLSRPEDAMAAIRGSILANAVLPDIQVQAAKLAGDLNDLSLLRQRIEGNRNRLRSQYSALGEQQSRINLLIEAKRGQRETSAAELSQERRKVEALAAEAESLEALIRSLEKQSAAAGKALREAAAASGAAQRMSREEARKRLSDTSRIRPAVLFSEAGGLLPLPVAGTTAMKFGDPDGFGGISQGLSIAGRPGSPVISPADSWVIYAGSFRSFGQVLILNAGEDYRIVLAGLDKIHVEPGQFVLAGEPVAVLGEKKLAGLGNMDLSSAKPMLYIEFRHNENSIDPTPWWSGQNTEEVRG